MNPPSTTAANFTPSLEEAIEVQLRALAHCTQFIPLFVVLYINPFEVITAALLPSSDMAIPRAPGTLATGLHVIPPFLLSQMLPISLATAIMTSPSPDNPTAAMG